MGTDYKINLIVNTKKNCPDKASLRSVAEKTFKSEGITNSVSLNILLTGNKKIQELNRRFLGRDTPTDVISFGMKRSRGINKSLKGFIGDIAISVEAAEYNSKRFNIPKEKEIFLYIIHGILHLLGYADKTKKEIRIIQSRQNKILETVCGGS